MTSITEILVPTQNPDMADLRDWLKGPEFEEAVSIVNDGSTPNGIRITCSWTGSTASPYQNNDSALIEVENTVVSNSLNRSWAVSAANFKNDIPVGVTDSGERVAVLGWSVSTSGDVDFVHAGTLALQTGVSGRAGFQGSGTPATAVITAAVGVRGSVMNDSAGTTITTAYGGQFTVEPDAGEIETIYAVYAQAVGGTTDNFSFFGQNGKLFNNDSIDGSEYLIAGTEVLNFDGAFTRLADPDGTYQLYLHAGGVTLAGPSTPASASATGVAGTIKWDANYLYICIATDTWRRIAHATW